MTDGVTNRIFALIEAVAMNAIRTGDESITINSFDAQDWFFRLSR